MDERNSQYKLEASRNGLTVPVINDVYLHSIYNPVKEANAFALTQEKNIKIKKHILILGLGFGYHVEEIARIASQHHSDYQVVILEPNKRLVDDFINTRNFEDKKIKIICMDSVKELFGTWEFVKFLMNKPCIIKHDASFIVEREFYSSFLSYQASKDLYNVKNLTSTNAKEMMQETIAGSLSSEIKRIESSGIQTRNEHFLMAFNQISILNNQGR
jgi:hypothetical protein